MCRMTTESALSALLRQKRVCLRLSCSSKWLECKGLSLSLGLLMFLKCAQDFVGMYKGGGGSHNVISYQISKEIHAPTNKLFRKLMYSINGELMRSSRDHAEHSQRCSY